jgi:uncharacterized protein
MRQDNEPSVEEILASIKKVIARDNRESAAEQRRTRSEQTTPAAPADSDVLDLGQAGRCLDDEGDAPLLNEAISASMRESLDALAMLAEPGARPQIVRSGETSLEGMVREMLRPMLAQWLDQNLPGMVERLVSAEIARIAGKRG